MQPLRKETDKRMELFRERLENILNREHGLYRLAGLINWELFEREFGKSYAPATGRPGIPIRLLVGLSCLGHVYGLSDAEVVARWVENPYWQYFCGETCSPFLLFFYCSAECSYSMPGYGMIGIWHPAAKNGPFQGRLVK